MKKGKEWLKEVVGELNLVDTVFEADGVSYIDTAVSVMQVYDLIEQLDEPKKMSEPEKVSIPKFIADFIEQRKGTNTYHLRYILYVSVARNESESLKEEYEWISLNSELFAKAWLNGYEVRKEKLYVVELSNDHLINYLACDLVYKVFFISKNQEEKLNKYKKKFTEKEIKDYDERFWPFAVEVSE